MPKKLIRSSTMKCLINQKIKNNFFNTAKKGKIIYSRNEQEGKLNLLDDFSIDKYAFTDSNNKNGPRFTSPIIVRWDLTYSCNFECIHCYSSCQYDKKNHLSLLKAKKLVDIFDQEKVQFVQILGGEPFIYPKIFELIEHALSKKFIFCLNSNGYLLNQNKIDKLADIGLEYMQISLYGFEKDHEKVTTQNNSFKKTEGNIKLLLKKGINLSISCVISNINKDTIFEFLSHLTQIGINNIQLLTPLQQGRATKNNFYLDSESFNTLKDKLIEFKNSNPEINIDLPGFDIDLIDGIVNDYIDNPEFEFMFGCIGGVSGIRVDPLGNACICVGKASQPIGNLLEEPMDSIMKKLYQWRKQNIPEICKGCESYLKDCQGACYLRF